MPYFILWDVNNKASMECMHGAVKLCLKGFPLGTRARRLHVLGPLRRAPKNLKEI
jgi:hypothetical protein